MLDRVKEQEYINSGGGTCPNCGSCNLEGGSFDCYGGGVSQQIFCCNCDASWCDEYTLAGIDGFKLVGED